MTGERHVRLVSLWIHPGQEAAFEAFEREAAALMSRNGGRIDQAVRLDPDPAGQGPFEVHVVSFPDQAAFEAYVADPATQALRARRGTIISRTVVSTGRPVGPY